MITKHINLWYQSLDKKILTLFLLLVAIGIIASFSASPPVAMKLKLDLMHFARNHFVYAILCVITALMISYLPPKVIRSYSLYVLIASMLMVVAAVLLSSNIKGASRWIYIFGISIQPAEFLKVMLVPIYADIYSKYYQFDKWKTHIIVMLIGLISVILLMMQPDFGMSILVVLVTGMFLFIMNISIPFILISTIGFIIFSIFIYFSFHHVHERINAFFGDRMSYQIEQALTAFREGGIFGTGPGAGITKYYVPDSYTDFVFAVISEEFGALMAILLMIIYVYLYYNILKHAFNAKNFYKTLVLSGLGFLFIAQSIIHILSNIALIPTKGMTLPLISYGGSSMLSSALVIGIILSFTRKTEDIQ